jgi:hypothetical protein
MIPKVITYGIADHRIKDLVVRISVASLEPSKHTI